jgi:hypothetical protein
MQNKVAVMAVVAILVVAVLGVFVLRRDSGGGGEDGGGAKPEPAANFTVVENTASGTLTVGTGGGSTSSTDLITFTVEEGAKRVKVICDGSNGSLGAGDIDMNVYGANEGYGPDARKKTSATGGSYEVVEIDRTDIEKRFGYGEYTVELINFAGLFLTYDLYTYVYYPLDPGDGGDEGGDGGGNRTAAP